MGHTHVTYAYCEITFTRSNVLRKDCCSLIPQVPFEAQKHISYLRTWQHLSVLGKNNIKNVSENYNECRSIVAT